MPVLNEEQKRAIVQGLACFRTPSEVSEDVKEEFGVEIGREHVRRYNPQQCDDVAKKWCVLFEATRKRFIAETAEIPISHQAFRLRELLDLYRQAKRSRNAVLAASLLEQAAKEGGGAFTNHRVLRGAVATGDLSSVSDEQLDRLIAGEDPEVVFGRGANGAGSS